MNKKNKLLKNIGLILLLLLVLSSSANQAKAATAGPKKALILIIDEVSLENILESKAPNITYLIDQGAVGLMNTRAKSAVSNRGSSYLSLGMGVRTLASTQAGLAYDYGQLGQVPDYFLAANSNTENIYKLYTGQKAQASIINLAIEDIKRTALDITPNNRVGALGDLAKENNLGIGLVGNADFISPSREATMMAMDSEGLIPYGSVSDQLLMEDDLVLGGIRLDQAKLLDEIRRIIPKTDILFIDYGDTVRVSKSDRLAGDEIRKEEKLKAIRRADFVLGEVMKEMDLDNSLFMVISPNPSKEMIGQGNFGLSPVIIYQKDGGPGLLSSNLTRRDGLVTNFDFGASLMDFFQVGNSKELSGEPMQVIENNDPAGQLLSMEASFLYIRKYRSIFHWIFIGLGIISILALFLPDVLKRKALDIKLLTGLVLSCLSLPLLMLIVGQMGYRSLLLDLVFVIGGSVVLAGLIYLLSARDFMASLTIISGLTSVFILLDGYFLNKYMIISPLGSDAIAGGRFYGIGNDYMGILIGSSLIFIFSLLSRLKVSRLASFIFTGLYMGLVVLALSPLYGANMGGTIAGISVVIFSYFIIFDKKLSFKRLALIGALGLIFILGVASLDAILNPSPTHAGKAIIALASGGYNKLFEIIRVKLGQVFYNLAHSAWNMVLFLEIGLSLYLFVFKKDYLASLELENPTIFKAFKLIAIDALLIFMFNDTGTIAAALILLYCYLPLGLLYNKARGKIGSK